MESATTSNRTLTIDGMSGDACVQKVTGALKGVHGVATQSVKVGGASISADQAGCNAACAAIDQAGYKSHESTRNNQSNGSPTANPANPSGQKGGSSACTSTQNASTNTPADAANPAADKRGERQNATPQAKPAVATT